MGPDVRRVDVRVGGAQHDLDGGIELADARRGPYPVGTRRHAHIEKRHRERRVGRDRIAHRFNRRFGALAEHRRESRVARRRFLGHPQATGGKQPLAQIVEHGGLAAHVRLGQDLAVCSRTSASSSAINTRIGARSVFRHGFFLRFLVPSAGPSNAAMPRVPGLRSPPRSARPRRRSRSRTSAVRCRSSCPST